MAKKKQKQDYGLNTLKKKTPQSGCPSQNQ